MKSYIHFRHLYYRIVLLYCLIFYSYNSNANDHKVNSFEKSNIQLIVQLNEKDTHSFNLNHENVKDINELSKERGFHSNIYVLRINDDKYSEFNGEWIVKSVKSEDQILELISARLAYLISKALELELVPETFLSLTNNKLCVLQRFIKSEKPKVSLYQKILKQEIKEIQRLKLFWFITGNWDIGTENIFFIQENGIYTPITIDNGALCYNTYVASYGTKPFKKTEIYVSTLNQNSLQHPIKIDWCLGTKFIEELKKNRIEIADYEKLISPIKPDKYYSFEFFVKNNQIYRSLWNESEIYKLNKCDKEVLEQFSKLDKDLCVKLFQQLKEELSALGVLKENLMSKINTFEADFIERVESRQVMVREYFV